MDNIFVKSMQIGTSKEALLEQLKKSVTDNRIAITEEELVFHYERSCKAYDGVNRYSGEEYVTHPLNVAIILSEIEATPEMVLAGLFCDVKKKGNYSLVCNCLDENVKELVEKIDCERSSKEVKIIKLAERLHNMRTIAYMDPAGRAEKARETLELYLPIARKIGNQKLVDELTDLSLKYHA